MEPKPRLIEPKYLNPDYGREKNIREVIAKGPPSDMQLATPNSFTNDAVVLARLAHGPIEIFVYGVGYFNVPGEPSRDASSVINNGNNDNLPNKRRAKRKATQPF